jgi:hypothetical protein
MLSPVAGPQSADCSWSSGWCGCSSSRGAWNVRRSACASETRNGNMSEIDVIAGIGPFKTYIECKNYSGPPRAARGRGQVCRCAQSLNGIPLSRGLFITTSTYVPRARTIGVRTVDGRLSCVALERSGVARGAAALLRSTQLLLLVPVSCWLSSEFTDILRALSKLSKQRVPQPEASIGDRQTRLGQTRDAAHHHHAKHERRRPKQPPRHSLVLRIARGRILLLFVLLLLLLLRGVARRHTRCRLRAEKAPHRRCGRRPTRKQRCAHATKQRHG